MEEMTYEMEKVDDVMPGFRFHPTDEELVSFYLKRKVQQKSLPIELIKQVDIYKYDPWELPRLASSGEKEWYFYCPRDRKYRNSPRPNRVIKGGYGFWKATGTDKAIYSSEGKCIGLKKSLVFYKGKAAKGEKTDWMMHEFRLPSISVSAPSKKFSDKSYSPNDSWAICRIFMKANSSNNVQKALSHPWISQLPGSMVFDLLTKGANYNQFSSENIAELVGGSSNSNNNNFSVSNIPTTYTQQISNNSNTNSKPLQINVSNNGDFGDNLIFQTLEATSPTKYIYDATSLLSNTDFIGLEEPNQQYSGFSISLPNDMQTNEWELAGRTIGFPFNLSPNDAWMGLTQ